MQILDSGKPHEGQPKQERRIEKSFEGREKTLVCVNLILRRRLLIAKKKLCWKRDANFEIQKRYEGQREKDLRVRRAREVLCGVERYSGFGSN